jgi:mannose-1-phosphate guanylyltransferase
VVIVDRSHRRHVDQPVRERVGTVLYQPVDRGTAVGVLMALMPVLESDPDALVVLTPSDHGVTDDDRFRRGVRDTAAHLPDDNAVALFGAEPASANDDYGWIVPGETSRPLLCRPVELFVEKPPLDYARQLYEAGAVWNTMVVVARAAAIWALYLAHSESLARVFDAAMSLDADERETFLSRVYPELTPTDFSRDILTPARGLRLYTWPSEMGWSDLGTPERLSTWLGAAHVRPLRDRAPVPA